MRFTPKTEKEIQEDNLLPEGNYSFEISGAEEKISKSGNEMIQLLIRVYKPDGKFNLINDYLLESMAHKLRHCCESCGILDKYDAGALLADDFIGKTGNLKLSIQKDKTGAYPDKNSIKDYIVGEKVFIPKSPLQEALDEKDEDDTIPF